MSISSEEARQDRLILGAAANSSKVQGMVVEKIHTAASGIVFVTFN
jgi:hypothetical protein